MNFKISLPAVSRKIWLTMAMFFVAFVAFGFYVYTEKRIDRANELRQISYQLADQLRQSSDDLTRMARTYVVTGDPRYKNYYQDILDIRNGKKPRPEGYLYPYWDLMLVNTQPPYPENGQAISLLELMRQSGFTDAEFGKLAKAKTNSDRLTALEFDAMKLVEPTGPDAEAKRARALLMLHDENYHQTKASIMKPIKEFYVLMDKRTLAAVRDAEAIALICRMIFIAVTLVAIFMLLRAYAALRATLGGSADEVHAQMHRIGRGDFSAAITAVPGMESSVLAGLSKMQNKLYANEIERKQAEESIRISQVLFSTIFKQAPLGIALIDSFTGQIYEVNHRFAEIAGRTIEEMTTIDWMSITHPDDVQEDLDNMALMNAGKIPGFKMDKRYIRPDGSIVWINMTIAPLSGGNVSPRHLCMIDDISERKRIEGELLITQTAIEKSRSAFYRVNAAGRVLYANDYACQSLGYTREEMLSMHVWQFDPNFPPEAWAPMWEGLRQTKVVNIETIHRRKDGTIFPVEIVGNVVNTEEEGEYSSVFVHDITKRKHNELRIQRLSHLYQALSEVNEAIVRMQQQAELFPLVCRCAVDFGGMKMAWVGQLDEANGNILPVARHGDTTGYLDSIPVSSRADVPEGRGTTGTALRENRAVIVNDYLNDPMTAPWKAHAANLGWASAAAFPIQRGGRPFAVLTVCHALANAFDEEVIALLEEMSKDIAFALDNFDRETRRKAAEESLRLAASVYETSSEAMSVTDADGIILTVNPAFTKVTGYLPEEVIGKDSNILSSGRHDEAFYQAMWQDITTSGSWQGEIWDQRKNGEVYPKWLTINTVFNEDGTVQQRVAMFTDISRKREAEELIWRQANFDPLTELPNRQMFHDRLDQDIKKAHRAGRPLALMFLDLDRFKEVNDSLGHDKGDALLQEAAQRLSSCVRETDTVARLGGDEFTVILGELDDPGSVERVAQEILRKLAEPFQLGEDVAYVSASIGITLYPEDAAGIEVLLRNADQAMYAAKNQGRNRYSYFTPSMQQAVQARVQIANDLRGALANNQFWIAYQPIVELATGTIHKAEALLRWQHPTQGLISPTTFIAVAEDTGLIVDIGDWVFREAAQQVKLWRTSLHPEFQISINKSPVQFRNEKRSHQEWYDLLRQLGLPGQSIVVEITEGLLLDADPLVTDRLLEFRDAGIQVSLDDFGTGYSALAYLKKFDIDYLKIDQSFTRNLAPGSDDMALCEAIIVMAHKLGIQVIAEGIETVEQKNLLTAAGCDYGQGYLFSRPIPANEFEQLWQKV